MILAVLLTIVFVFMAFYTAVFVRRVAIRNCIFLAYGVSVVLVWNPEATTVIANYFGMGRGLDFVLLLFSVAIVNGIFFIAKHLNSQHQSITNLARYIALRDASRRSTE
jgi:hypothetical protein